MEQWQDELFFKFGPRLDTLTGQLIDAGEGARLPPHYVERAFRSAFGRLGGPLVP